MISDFSCVLNPFSSDREKLEDDGFYSGFDDHEDMKPKGNYPTQEVIMFLVPVLRYLITVNGKNTGIDNTPLIALLPIVLQSANSWWAEEQASEIARSEGEKVLGIPVYVSPRTIPGNEHSKSKGSGKAKSASSQNYSGTSGSSGRKRPRFGVEEKAENLKGDDTPPPNKKAPQKTMVLLEESLEEELHFAIRSKDFQDVEALLKKGANPNIDFENTYPLHLAIEVNDFGIFKLLLDFGADIEVKNSVYETPLMNALTGSADMSIPFVEILLLKGASVTGFYNSKTMAFSLFLSEKWDFFPNIRELALQALKREGGDLNSYHKIFGYEEKPIIYSVLDNLRDSSVSLVKWLIENGVDVKKEENDDSGPMKIEPIAYLIKKVLSRASLQLTSETIAETVKILLQAGAYVEWNDFISCLGVEWDQHQEVRDLMAQSLKDRGIDISKAYFYRTFNPLAGEVRKKVNVLFYAIHQNLCSEKTLERLFDECRGAVTITLSQWDKALFVAFNEWGSHIETIRSIVKKIDYLIRKRTSSIDSGEECKFVTNDILCFSLFKRLLEKEWDECSALRKILLQQIADRDLDLNELEYKGELLIVHIASTMEIFSDAGLSWLLSNLVELSLIDKNTLGLVTQKVLDLASEQNIQKALDREKIRSTLLQRPPVQEQEERAKRLHQILSRFTLLLECGPNIFFIDDEKKTVFTSLLGEQWDELPEFRKVVSNYLSCTGLASVEIDGFLIMRHVVDLCKSDRITTLGLYFVFQNGLFPDPVKNSENPVLQELNGIYQALYSVAGLQLKCIKALLCNTEYQYESLLLFVRHSIFNVLDSLGSILTGRQRRRGAIVPGL